MAEEADLLTLASFLAVSAGLTLFHTFPKDPLDISSEIFTVAGSLLWKQIAQSDTKDYINVSFGNFLLL